MKRILSVTLAGIGSLMIFPAMAQNGGTKVEITGHVLKPEKLAPTQERISALSLPDGFEITAFAENLVNPRMLAVADDGTVYATRRTVGDVVMLRDEDGDGRSDSQTTVATRPGMHGIAIDGDTAYLVTIKEVYRTTIADDGTFGELERIIDDLPDAGQHPNRTIAIGPEGKLFISVGSTCNACGEDNPENATLLRAEPDGSNRMIYASGLRNTIGFGWHPETGVLYGMDHGIDWLGDEEHPEELNRIQEGRQYGWPYIYADGKKNPQDEPPGGITQDEWAQASEEPLMGYTPHAAPMQMAFHDGTTLPADHRGDAFVAMRGSWNRQPPSGYEVVRIHFEDGEPQSIEPFLTGFLIEQEDGSYGQMARLAGIATAPDGAIYLSDDSGGVIYRITYTGEGASQNGSTSDTANLPEASNAPIPPEEAPKDTPKLAAEALQTGDGELDLDTTFSDGGTIPEVHAREGQNISPRVAWSEGPEGTQSYVVMLEDPDAPQPEPFVHWLAWAIPADVTELREGLPAKPQLPLPEGLRQGQNSRGSTGYTGPNPPAGETHTYHLQVFALDTMPKVPAGADRKALLEAMEGHVLATGTITGEFGG